MSEDNYVRILNGNDVKKILLVDDSSLVRNNLKRIISSIPNLHFAGEASDLDTAIRFIDELKPDILILDINLGLDSGIDVLTMLKNNVSRPIIIMFTIYSQGAFKKKAAKLGADYFFDKNKEIESLFEILIKLSEID